MPKDSNIRHLKLYDGTDLVVSYNIVGTTINIFSRKVDYDPDDIRISSGSGYYINPRKIAQVVINRDEMRQLLELLVWADAGVEIKEQHLQEMEEKVASKLVSEKLNNNPYIEQTLHDIILNTLKKAEDAEEKSSEDI